MSKKRSHRPRDGIMGRSDIPFAQRIQMQQRSHIAQATQGAGICATIAANDVWGWAEKRIRPVLDLAREHMARYAKEGEQFLLDYLEKLGFVIVDGHAVGFVDENDQPVRQKVEGL